MSDNDMIRRGDAKREVSAAMWARSNEEFQRRLNAIPAVQPTVSPKQLAAHSDDVVTLVEALRSTLNFIENTEGEMGVILGCGNKARAALAREKAVRMAADELRGQGYGAVVRTILALIEKETP